MQKWAKKQIKSKKTCQFSLEITFSNIIKVNELKKIFVYSDLESKVTDRDHQNECFGKRHHNLYLYFISRYFSRAIFFCLFLSTFNFTSRWGYVYRSQRSCGQGYVFTRVCDSVHIGGAIPACLAAGLWGCGGGVPGLGCLVWGGLLWGVPGPEGVCSWWRGVPAPRGSALGGGLLPGGVAFCYGLLVWSFWLKAAFWLKVVFCYGLLMWSSVMAFW